MSGFCFLLCFCEAFHIERVFLKLKENFIWETHKSLSTNLFIFFADVGNISEKNKTRGLQCEASHPLTLDKGPESYLCRMRVTADN